MKSAGTQLRQQPSVGLGIQRRGRLRPRQQQVEQLVVGQFQQTRQGGDLLGVKRIRMALKEPRDDEVILQQTTAGSPAQTTRFKFTDGGCHVVPRSLGSNAPAWC